jgi:hypothetical protein
MLSRSQAALHRAGVRHRSAGFPEAGEAEVRGHALPVLTTGAERNRNTPMFLSPAHAPFVPGRPGMGHAVAAGEFRNVAFGATSEDPAND